VATIQSWRKTATRPLQQLNRVRGLMLGREAWPATLVDFEKRWTEYKRENSLLDFTDMIETCLRDVYIAPKNPSVNDVAGHAPLTESRTTTRSDMLNSSNWKCGRRYAVAR